MLDLMIEHAIEKCAAAVAAPSDDWHRRHQYVRMQGQKARKMDRIMPTPPQHDVMRMHDTKVLMAEAYQKRMGHKNPDPRAHGGVHYQHHLPIANSAMKHMANKKVHPSGMRAPMNELHKQVKHMGHDPTQHSGLASKAWGAYKDIPKK
jgi:hypothetical protein